MTFLIIITQFLFYLHHIIPSRDGLSHFCSHGNLNLLTQPVCWLDIVSYQYFSWSLKTQLCASASSPMDNYGGLILQKRWYSQLGGLSVLSLSHLCRLLLLSNRKYSFPCTQVHSYAKPPKLALEHNSPDGGATANIWTLKLKKSRISKIYIKK